METHRHRTQAGRLHRSLAGQPAAAVRPLHGLAIRAHPRNRSHHGPAQGQMGGEPRAARALLGEINTITKDEFKNNYARNWNFKNTDPLYWRPPAGESIADVAEDRVHNILTSLSRKSDSESVVMVTHGDFMLALMLTIEDLADEEFLHRADSDDWKITNCTCLHYTRRDPETGRTSKRVRWEQTARPVLDETTGRWEVKVEPWREFKRPYLSNGDLVDVVQAVDPHLLEYYGK
ncbi:MAG: histidine phosphatase family protein [Bifidobacterium breve]|nr:histidine phosphatase family protein [Bifidobacterium breve]